MRRSKANRRQRQQHRHASDFRQAIQFESLEARLLMTVTSRLVGGELAIDFDADRDAAAISVVGSSLQVASDSRTEEFPLAEVRSISATSSRGVQQSITFADDVTLSGALSVRGIGEATFAAGSYRVGSASIVTTESIEFTNFSLLSNGTIDIASRNTLNQTENGLLGFLGAVADGSSSITILDSNIEGGSVSIATRLEINANASRDTASDSNRDFARVKSVGTSSIIVGGRTRIVSQAALAVLAESLQTITASAVAQPTANSASRDAALALTNVTSTATVDLGDSTILQAGTALTAKARNIVTVTTTADGSLAGGGGKGGVVALAEFTGTTTVSIRGNTFLSGASVAVDADSSANLTTNAKSTIGGANANDPSTTSEISNNQLNTTSGGMGVAGALARTKSNRTTQVTISGQPTIQSTGLANVTSNASGNTSTTADGSTTNNAGGTGDGVGVAIALDRTTSSNRLVIDGSVTFRATTVNLVTSATAGDLHTTTATSGVGSGDFAGAGSFARTNVDSLTETALTDLAGLSGNGSNLVLNATGSPTMTTTARPAGTTSVSGQKGIGASVAQSKLVNQTTTRIGKSVPLTGFTSLTMNATAIDNVNTTATTGAEGGASTTVSAATAIVDSTATALIDTGSTTSLAGSLNVLSNHAGTIITSANGETLGEQAARGGSFALNDIDINSQATLSRSVTASGDVNISATESGTQHAEAKASAQGSGPSNKTSDQQTLEEQQAAGSDKQTPSADAKGKVTVAAATAINLVDARAQASIDQTLVVNAGNRLTVAAANSSDGDSKGDASAVGGGTTTGNTTTGGTEKGRAIAVAINRVNSDAKAIVDSNTSLLGTRGVSVSASTTNGEDTQHNFAAEAIAGAGARTVGFAGSFAMNKVANQSLAQVAAGTTINAGDGELSITSANTAINNAKASPSVPTTGATRGIGASFAINIGSNESIAQTLAGSNLVDSVTVSSEKRNRISATSTQTALTEGKGGAGAESTPGQKALTPVFAIQSISNVTDAKALGNVTGLAGSLGVTATLVNSSTVNAEGTTVAQDAARGLVMGMDLGENLTTALAGGTQTIDGSLSINARAAVTQSVQSKASSKGGDVNPLFGGTNKETADGKQIAINAGARDNGEQSPDQKSPEGSIALAGALAVGLTKTRTTAKVNDAANINAKDAISIESRTNMASSVKADATALTVAAANKEATGTDPDAEQPTNDASGRGVGAAVAVQVNKTQSTAAVNPSATVRSSGLNLRADSDLNTFNSFSTEAVSGAGGGRVGKAGSFAIQVVRNTMDAHIGAASIDAGSGNLQIIANNQSVSNTKASPSSNATGTQRGRGASVAINSTHNTTVAEMQDGSVVRNNTNPATAGAANLTIRATSNNTTTTQALGGAGSESDVGDKAATGVFSLARVINTTTAQAAASESARSVISGSMNIESTHNGLSTTTAEGSARAEKTSVGIVLGLGFIDDNTTAALHDQWQSGSTVSVQATDNSQAIVNSKASARGGEADKKNEQPGKGEVTVKTSESKNVLADADGQAIDKDVPDIKTPDSSLALAGSLAVNVGSATTEALLGPTANVQTSGQVRVGATAQTKVTSQSDASAVVIPAGENNDVQNSSNNNSTPPAKPDPSQTGVGVAIDVNVANIATRATVSGGASVKANALSIDAGTASAGDKDHLFDAKSISGAGVDKVGFAGALTIQIVSNDVKAELASASKLELTPTTDPDLTSSSQDLSITSRNETGAVAAATGSVAGSPTTGIGPTIVVSVAQNSSQATLNEAEFLSPVRNITVAAQGDTTSLVQASSGATARATVAGDGGLAVSPALAVSVHQNSITAHAGEGNQFDNAQVTGNLSVTATHESLSGGTAQGLVNANGNAAVGTPVVVNVALDDTQASTSGTFVVGGTADVLAKSDLTIGGDAFASVQGARAGSQGAGTLQDRAQQWATGFRRTPGEPREAILERLEDRLTELGDKLEELSQAKAETVGVAASAVANVAMSNTIADVNGSILATGDVRVIAESDRDVAAQASSLAASPTFSDGVGAALALNIAEQTIIARAQTDNALTGDQITLRASGVSGDTHLLSARALAGGGGKENGRAGSIGINIAKDKIQSMLGVSPVENGTLTMNVNASSGLTIDAQANLEVQTVAGAAGVGVQSEAFGGALALSAINTTTEALTGTTTTVNAGGLMRLSADSHIAPTKGDLFGDPMTLAAGGSLGGDQARAGAVAVNLINEQTRSEVGSGNQLTISPRASGRITAPGNLQVTANSDTELRTGAGAIALTKGLGQGVGATASIINGDTIARVGNGTQVSTGGEIRVSADSHQDLFSIAAAPTLGGSSGKPTFGGAVGVVSQVFNTLAEVGDNVVANSQGNIVVRSNHIVDVDSIAGALSINFNNASVAGSLSIVSLLDRTEARVGTSSNLTTAGGDGLQVTATSNENVTPIAIGGSGAGGNSTAGSMTLNRIHQTTLAHIDDNTTLVARNLAAPLTTTPGILVNALDSTKLTVGVGTATISGSRGIGGSLDATKVEKSTRAFVGSGVNLDADRNITINATSSEDLFSQAASTGTSSQTTILGALNGTSLDITTQAVLGDNPLDQLAPATAATVHARGSIIVTADDASELDFNGGAFGSSLNSSAGGAAAIQFVGKQTEARIAQGAVVDADALDTVPAASVPNGKFSISFPTIGFDGNGVVVPALESVDSDGDGVGELADSSITRARLSVPQLEQRRGVIVVANNRDDVAALVVGGGGAAGGFAIGISTPAAIVRSQTTATIDADAEINTNNQAIAGPNQSVVVAAGDDYSHLGLTGALTLSTGVSVAPAANVESTRLTTTASIGASAEVVARQDVLVQANATEDSFLVTAAGSVSGTGGGNGSIAVFALDNKTHAFIDAGADVDAGGNVVVTASDTSDLDTIAGAAAFGASAGVSISSAINVIHKDTQAFIADQAIVDAKANSTNVSVRQDIAANSLTSTSTRGVIVEAISKETLLDVAAAGSGSGGFAGAGSVNVSVFDSDTSAFIGQAAKINTTVTGANQLQSVHVVASNELDAKSVAGGLAIGGGALAGSADIGIIRNDTTATIGSNAVVKANSDIVTNALARQDANSVPVSGGFAATGSFAAAVSVWAVGTKFDPTYSDDSTTANSLSSGDSSVNSQAAASGGNTASILASVLGNFEGVNNTTQPVNPTPTDQIADILRSNRQRLADDSLSADEIQTDLSKNSSVGGTIAEVRAGASLNAGDDVIINAKSDVELTSNAGSASAAAAVAAGAAINVQRIHLKTDALLAGSVVQADQVSVTANFDNDALARSLAGQGAIGGALGAAVATIRDASSTTARIDGSVGLDARIDKATAVIVRSTSDTNLESRVGQGTVALGGAVGVAVSRVAAEGTTAATVGDHVQIGQSANETVGSLTVDANANNHLEAHGTAVAAGVGAAGALNFSKAEITSAVDATVGNRAANSNSHITLTGPANITADSTDMAAAKMLGLTLAGGAALGIGRATAKVAPEVEAAVGRQTSIESSSIQVLAANHLGTFNNGGSTTPAGAFTSAESAAGAAVARNNAQAFSTTSPTIDATIYNDSQLTSTGLIEIRATADNHAEATGGGLTVGVVGVGGVETDATISGIADASVLTGVSINAANLQVLSQSQDRALSEGRAAAGGLIASGTDASPNATSTSANVVTKSRNGGGKTGFGLPGLEPSPNSSVSVQDATVNVSGNVTIAAEQQVDADAMAKGISIAVGKSAGQSLATVNVKPRQLAQVQGSSMTAGGVISVESSFGSGSNPAVVAMDITETDAVANNEVSTAYAKGSGGALLGSIGSIANNVYQPVGDAKVNRSTLTAASIGIRTDSDTSAAAVARNFSAGLVARGTANASLNMKDDMSALVDGSSESERTTINAINTFSIRVVSEQDGDAFSNTRAIAGLPTGRATTSIRGDYDLSSTVGEHVDITAGSTLTIDSQVQRAQFGSVKATDPDDPTNAFGRPNFIGASANSDTGGVDASAFATASTLLGTAANPSQSVASVGAFSQLKAPQVTITSDINRIQLRSDANARSGGLIVGMDAKSTGEVHTNTRVVLNSDSNIDATTATIQALNGSVGSGIQSEVESTTDKDGLAGDPSAIGTIRMDTTSTIDANDRARIATRNLTVRADTDVTQFDLTVLENNTPRADSGTRISSFARDRSILWDADVVLKGIATASLVVDANGATGANVVQADGITIQDTDATLSNNGTLGNVAAPSIVVNPINNASAYGNVLFEIPRRGPAADDTGIMDGQQGSFTVMRAFEAVNITNHSAKPVIVNAINVFNNAIPEIVVDAPNSAALSFPIFHNFGDTKINITNDNKAATNVSLNGLIQNPVGETFVDASGSIVRSGSGRIASNVVDLRSRSGNIGSSTSRIPIDLIISAGRAEDLRADAGQSLFLDLTAHERIASSTTPLVVDASSILAGSTADVRLHTSVRETTLPLAFPSLKVNEIQEADITFAVSFFETNEEFFNLDLGALATAASTAIPSEWSLGLIKGTAITVTLDPVQIDGPLLAISGNTDVGSNVINVSTNGDINLTEAAGAMRIGAITTTRGNVTLTSLNSIGASPVDAAADVIGTVVTLNAATTIGATGAAVDVDSGNQLNANAGGNIVLVETSGNANVGLIAATNGTVSLTATAGSILDATADAAADVVGSSITLTATNSTNTVAPTIGTSTNPLEVDSSVGSAGSVRAVARGDVMLVETSGSMNLAEARSTSGNIRIDVPDTASTGSDLVLSTAQVVASAGSVQLNAGDDFNSNAGSVIQGTVVGIVADFGNADPGVGSAVAVGGSITGRPITISTGADLDTITLQQTAFQGPVTVNAGSGDDAVHIDRLAPLTSTVGSVRDALTVNLGSGNNNLLTTLSPTGNYIGNVTGDRSSFNTLQVNGTTANDNMLLNSSQFAGIHAGTVTTAELLNFGDIVDRVNVFPDAGNDVLTIDLAGGNVAFSHSINYSGSAGTDSILINGSAQADQFELDATGTTSGIIRTGVAGGPLSQPINLTSIEQVTFNGQAPTSAPGDVLRILDSVAVQPVVPAGSLTTPLPVNYTNIEQVLIGAQPVAVTDQITTVEDAIGSVNPFANDSGLTDLPVTVSIVGSANGTVEFRDNGTPNNLADDRLFFTPAANFSGTTSFQYTVRDVNGDLSTATVNVTVTAVTDAPIVNAANAAGNEGTAIPLSLTAELADRDGSESLSISITGVPDLATFVNAVGQAVGTNRGNGLWTFRAEELREVRIVTSDSGRFDMTLVATAAEANDRIGVSASAPFSIEVANVAPTATIMEAPSTAPVNQPISVRMAATDPSSVDQSSGFLYRVNWGDGTPIETVQGQPGVGPTLQHTYTRRGIFTVTVTATDKDGQQGPSATRQINVAFTGLVDDPINPGQQMLQVAGSLEDDDLVIQQRGNGRRAQLELLRDGVSEGLFTQDISRIVVHGYAGNDSIFVSSDVDIDTWVFGGSGDDTIYGGNGNNILVGAEGDDLLRGRGGEDILIGGRNADVLFGGNDNDLLVAGTTLFDDNEAALLDIQREWTSGGSLRDRIENLTGESRGGLNRSTFLRGGNQATALDDAAVDTLLNDKSNDWVLANSALDRFSPARYFTELGIVESGRANGEGEFGAHNAVTTEAKLDSSNRESFMLDVNGDGSISAIDALLVINRLQQPTLTADGEADSDLLVDVSHDDEITPIDALLVINRLNKRP